MHIQRVVDVGDFTMYIFTQPGEFMEQLVHCKIHNLFPFSP